jgi:hypothetical protein
VLSCGKVAELLSKDPAERTWRRGKNQAILGLTSRLLRGTLLHQA